MMKVKPLGDRVLVEPVEEKQQVKGGIIIPDSAKEKPQEAKVIAIGTGKLNEKGERIPFEVKVGDIVKAGQPVCIVEAMKLFNEIKAPCDGKITGILVEHGKPVKKDDPMISYEKA